MNITGTFQKSLRLQIQEGVNIKNKGKEVLLNSKAEFHRPSVLRRTFKNDNKCHDCNYISGTESAVKKPAEINHYKSQHECDECNSQVKPKVKLRKHIGNS